MARPHYLFLRASVLAPHCWAAPRPSTTGPRRCLKPIIPLSSRRYYLVDNKQAPAPAKSRGSSKVFESADEAIADVEDGAVILSAGFGLCGVAGMVFFELTKFPLPSEKQDETEFHFASKPGVGGCDVETMGL
jgi:hypothetical protein